MKYKLLKTIHPVHRVFVDNHNSSVCLWKYYDKKSGLSILDKNLNENEIIVEDDNIRFCDIKPSKEFYWCNTGVGGIFKISKDDVKISKEDFIVTYFLKNGLLLTSRREGKNKFVNCYDEKNEKTIWEQSFSSSRFHEASNNLFCVPGYSGIPCNHVILALNPNTGDVLWKHEEDVGYSISEIIELKKRISPPKISRIIGVFKEVLWFGVDKEILVGLNILTGKEVYREKIGSDSDSFYSVQSMHLDEEKGLIVGLGGTHYWEIDLMTKELTNWDLEDEFLPKKLRCMFASSSLYFIDKYVYFMSSGIFSNDASGLTWQIAVFNRESKKIDWNHEFNSEGNSFLTSFTATENGLFAIDWNKNLYVFEREK